LPSDGRLITFEDYQECEGISQEIQAEDHETDDRQPAPKKNTASKKRMASKKNAAPKKNTVSKEKTATKKVSKKQQQRVKTKVANRSAIFVGFKLTAPAPAGTINEDHWKAVEDISWDLGSYPIISIKSIPFAYREALRRLDNKILQSALRTKHPLVWKLHFLLPAMLLDPNSTLNSLEARFKAFKENQWSLLLQYLNHPGEPRYYKNSSRQNNSKLKEKR
jgi:hypothetical protein